MAIDRKDVRYVANLARLNLSDEEEDRFAGQLGDILDYVERLQEVNVDSVDPFISAASGGNVFREDRAHESLPLSDVLRNAPEDDGGGFLVPKVVDSGGDA